MQISTVENYQPAPRYPTPEIGAGRAIADEEPLIPRPVPASEEGQSSRPDLQRGESQRGEQPPRGDGEKQSAEESPDDRQLQELKSRDREVRAHEAAHLAAGSSVARGGMKFTFQRGPDGVMYAVGGEVSIDTSKGATPEETIQKAETIRRAALAPAEPSSQDRSIAAKAAQMAAQARIELAQQRREGDGESAFQTTGTATAIESYREENHFVVAMPGVDEMA